MDEEVLDIWRSRIGKFLMVDYETANGLKAVFGVLDRIVEDKIVLRNLHTDEESEIAIPYIRNCKVRDLNSGMEK